MAPYFIRNLVPRKQAHDHPRRPLSQVLGELTFIQWLQFSSGYKASPMIRLAETDAGGAVDGWLGLAMRLISSTLRSASLPWELNSTRVLLPSCVSPYCLCSSSLIAYETSDDGYHFDSSRPVYRRCEYIFTSFEASDSRSYSSASLVPKWSSFPLYTTATPDSVRSQFGEVLTFHDVTGFLWCPIRSLRTQVAAGSKSSPVLFGPTWHQLRPDLPAVPGRAVPFWYSDGWCVGSSLVYRSRKSPS
jgi:hypothetical protein